MSEADSGSGAGAVAAGASASSPAQVAAVDLDKLKAEIAEAARNSVYAELRRSGALKKSHIAAMEGRPENKAQQADTPAAPAFDPVRLRQLDRALGALGLSEKLSERAYKSAEKAFMEESPDDARAWAQDYFSFALGEQSAANPQPVKPPQSTTPVTDRGAPSPPRVSLDELDLERASDEDRAAYLRQHGPSKYKALLMKQAAGRRYDLKR
jgi:hypothetical protein